MLVNCYLATMLPRTEGPYVMIAILLMFSCVIVGIGLFIKYGIRKENIYRYLAVGLLLTIFRVTYCYLLNNEEPYTSLFNLSWNRFIFYPEFPFYWLSYPFKPRFGLYVLLSIGSFIWAIPFAWFFISNRQRIYKSNR